MIIGRSRRHAALLRDVQDGVALGMADVAVDPGDFDQRRQDERRAGVERDAELLDALEKRRLVRVKFLRQRVSNLAQLGLLAQLRDQLGIHLTEIGLLLATLTVTENVLCHNYLQSVPQCATRSYNTGPQLRRAISIQAEGKRCLRSMLS